MAVITLCWYQELRELVWDIDLQILVNLHRARDMLNTVWSFIWLYDSKRMLPEAFVIQLSRDVMTPSISEVLWPPGGIWVRLRSCWIIHLNSWYGLLHLRCWWGLFYCLLRVFEIPGHCEDNAYVSYLRYSGIVRTMPTYLIWDTPVLYGQCLRIFLDLWVFDLEVHFVTCTSVADSWRLVIAVSEPL